MRHIAPKHDQSHDGDHRQRDIEVARVEVEMVERPDVLEAEHEHHGQAGDQRGDKLGVTHTIPPPSRWADLAGMTITPREAP